MERRSFLGTLIAGGCGLVVAPSLTWPAAIRTEVTARVRVTFVGGAAYEWRDVPVVRQPGGVCVIADKLMLVVDCNCTLQSIETIWQWADLAPHLKIRGEKTFAHPIQRLSLREHDTMTLRPANSAPPLVIVV